ncbi:helix-turn-helix transcriptional regulator [Duganella hordei]|uniref:helix-turn-helix transcriptional regulator n=1 Tax=Duganella hordei TaxID=2865934 RepID=UPI0030EAF2E9
MKVKHGQAGKPVEQDRLIKLDEVQQICAMSRSLIYKEMRHKRFPAKIKLSKRSVAWSENEVLKWVADHKGVR